MREHVRLHRLYTSLPVRIVRLLLLLGLVTLSVTGFVSGSIPRLPMFLLSWVVMWEVFFHFSLSQIKPRFTVSQNDGKDPAASLTHEAMDSVVFSDKTEAIITSLLHFMQIHFFLERLEIDPRTLALVSLSKDDLLKKALTYAKERQGIYVTTMDVMAAYLHLIEQPSKLLFTRELNDEDMALVLTWAASTYSEEEHALLPHEQLLSDGFAESLVSGWTPETKKYTTDFTRRALTKPHGTVGREKEFEELVTALSTPEMRNVLLVGEPGVGKERLVTMLAQDSYLGRLPQAVNHKRVITLMVGPLLAGAENRALLEERLQTIIAELTHADNIILSIPELQDLMGESSYNINLSGALLPYLKDGNLPIIATMTIGNYKTFMEKSGLKEVFSVITLEEPDLAAVTKMLFHKLLEIEKLYGVRIPYKTVKEALRQAKHYLPDDVLPGNAIRLLSDAAQHAVSQKTPIVTTALLDAVVEEKTHTPVAAPKQEEKELLLHLEGTLHERIIGQEQAISVIAEAMRRLRSGVATHDRPVSFLFLGPTGVGKTETAKALADLYFGGESKMLRLDMSEYVDESSVARLLGAPPGTGDERGELTERIHDNPYTLVLLDEFEKAHPKILDLFLQILSDGRLTDNKGRAVSFTDAIIIATSNGGSEFIREELHKGVPITKEFQTKLLEQLETSHLFKPELLNRFDGIVTFTPLTDSQLREVVKLQLSEVARHLAEQDITVVFDEKVYDAILQNGYDEQFGARPLKRYIQDTVEDTIATLKLTDTVKRGTTITFTTNEKGAIVAT